MTVPDAGARARARDLVAAAARAPRELILARFRAPDLPVETKSDGTPVTAADRAAEAAIRRRLRGSAEFGAFEIFGEEGGAEGAPADCRWLIDPIDGTRGFGAERDGTRLRASGATDLRTAVIALPDVAEFREAGMEGAWAAVHAACDRVRGYTDCWAHALVVAGAVDAMLEAALSPWDVRATQVLVVEAGGAYRARPSRVAGRTDMVFGSPALVDRIGELAGFE